MVKSGVILPWYSHTRSWMFPSLVKEGKMYTLNEKKEIQEPRYIIFSSFEDLSDEEKQYAISRLSKLERAIGKIEGVLEDLEI